MNVKKVRSLMNVKRLKRITLLLSVALFLGVFSNTAFAALTCGGCHGYPPMDNVTRDGATGRFPGSHDKHAGTTTLNMQCTVCHVNNTAPNHRNEYIEMASPINGDLGAAYSKGASFLQTNATFSGGSCNGVYCHSTVQGANGIGAGTDKPQYWGAAGPLGCSACHADMSGASATGSHIKHTNNTAGNYNMPCSNCHPGYASSSTNDSIHANKTINVTLATGTYSGGTTPGDHTPGGGYGSCSSVYCHSNGNPYNGVNTYSAPSWGGSAVCGSCHIGADTYANMTGSITPSPLSGPHAKHMASDRYGANTSFTCNTCHANTASNNTTISSVATHANGTKDIAWNTTSIGNTPVAYNISLHQCQNVYCHGNGQSANPTVAAFNWSGTYSTCGECHGNASSPASLSGSHSGHINGGAACNSCHTATASSPSSIGSYSYHVDKKVTIQFDSSSAVSGATYSGSGAFSSPFQKAINSGFGSCTNIKCHSDGTALWSGLAGAGSTPVWGPTSATCNTCHGVSNGTPYTNDYRKGAPLYGSVTTQTSNAKPNAHGRHISNSSATLDGTGSETQCKHCHNSTTTNNTSIAGGSITHADGAYTVGGGSATYAGGNNVSTPAAVTLTYTPKTFAVGGASTCANVSCHPTGTTTANNTDLTIAWNDKAATMCTDCHSINMTANATYHHTISSETYTSSDTTAGDYPTAIPDGNYDNTSGGVNGTSRKCTMCHVKHNIFSDRTNTNAALTSPRAMNLRTSIAQSPSQSANYTNTDYVQGQGTNAGICISCHNASRTKDALRQAQVAGATKTLAVTDAQFTSSAHNFEVNRAMKTVGTSNFRANCSKCHTGDNTESGVTFQSSAPNVAVHDAVQRRLLTPLGSTAGDPLEEKVCYRCHSTTSDTNPGGGTAKTTANKDYYGVASMSNSAELLFSMFSKAFTHNVAGTSGVHKTGPNEGTNTSFYSTTTANTLYLRDNGAVNPLSSIPGAFQYSSGTYYTNGNTYTQKAMSPSQGTVAATTALAYKTTANYSRGIQFVSPQVDQTVTIASGSVFTLYIKNGVSNAGPWARFTVYKWDGTTATPVNTSAAPNNFAQNATAMPITAALQNWNLTSNQAITLNPGDSLACDVELYNGTAFSGTDKTATFYYGNNASDLTRLVLPAGTYVWRTSLNGDTTLSGSNRHAQCEDCHNVHAAQPSAGGALTGTLSSYASGGTTGNDTLTVSGSPWTTNAYLGWTVKITSGTGAGKTSVIYSNTANTLAAKFGTTAGILDTTSKFVIFKMGTSDGNLISKAQYSVWGVTPTSWPTAPTPPAWNDTGGCGALGTSGSCEEISSQFATALSWTRTESAATQGATCLKCHSSFAYGATPPNTPSAQPNGSGSAGSNTVSAAAMKQGDKAKEFNPYNLGYHPIFARGMNQPVRANYGNTGLVSAVNTNWPLYTAGSLAISSGAATLTGATLPPTALPGWFVYIGATAPTSGAATGASNNQTPGTASTGYLEITSITDPTHFTVRAETSATSAWPNATYTTTPTVASTASWFLTAGLGNTFVPPYGPWSTMQCTDCHTSDTTSDPMGPHGSAYKYLLINSLAKVFNAMTANNVVTYGITNTPTDGDNFCVNCHRRDVYGDDGAPSNTYNTYARVTHPMDTSSGQAWATKTTWGPVCMNCHGGARTGGIHGQNLGKGPGAGSYSGKRLLAGAYWVGVTRSTRAAAGSCYVKGAADAVSNCSNGNQGAFGGTGTTANYQFDDSTP